jgi:hypothetical protein
LFGLYLADPMILIAEESKEPDYDEDKDQLEEKQEEEIGEINQETTNNKPGKKISISSRKKLPIVYPKSAKSSSSNNLSEYNLDTIAVVAFLIVFRMVATIWPFDSKHIWNYSLLTVHFASML